MKKLFAILMAATLLMLSGCGGETTTSNSGKGSIDPAVFCLEDERYPRISVKEDGSFSITYTVMAEKTTYGTYTVSEDEILTLNADDGSVYNFKIESKAIVFDADTSSDFGYQSDGEAISTPEIADGTKFELWRKYE